MGDLRNKFAKIERTERHRAYLAKHYPPGQLPSSLYPTCECDPPKTVYTATVMAWTPDRWQPTRYICVTCAPHDAKMLIIEDMIRRGIRYDAAEHGDDQK